jgi:hypothetical protein
VLLCFRDPAARACARAGARRGISAVGVVALGSTPRDASLGEVPERLNGRDWKSRNGGNFVRGFESLPLRTQQIRSFRSFDMREPGDAALAGHDLLSRQAGIVDQRIESWFKPLGWTIPTGYIGE